jgi:hypothetical protein
MLQCLSKWLPVVKQTPQHIRVRAHCAIEDFVHDLHQKSALPVVSCRGHPRRSFFRPHIQLQPDAGPNPHQAAWPESLKETKHNPFTLGGIISTGPHV